MRAVVVVAGPTVSVPLRGVAEHAGLEPAVLAGLLGPLEGVEVADGMARVDVELLEAVHWAWVATGEEDDQPVSPAVFLAPWRRREQRPAGLILEGAQGGGFCAKLA